MIIVRSCKIALVAAIALFFTLVAYDNLTDYGSNWQFVQHVLAIENDLSGFRSALACDPPTGDPNRGLLADHRDPDRSNGPALVGLRAPHCKASKRRLCERENLAWAGLTLGLLLYIIGFVTIGGEWFAMWQSAVWNGQQKAFEFIGMIGLVLTVLLLPEAEA